MIRNNQEKIGLAKTKTRSPSLFKKEIGDVKKAPKTKISLKPSPDLTPQELRAIKRFESGKGKYVEFGKVEDAIKWLDGKKKPKSKK